MANQPTSTVVLDVRDEAQCRDFAARLRSEWKVVDVLINAAGYFPLTPFEELTYSSGGRSLP
jgi:NADP-dependent 3-hydroxy acid dehydrogenase YdfG